MRRRLVFVLLVLLSISCREIFAPASDGSTLAENRQKWARHGYTSYSFTMRRLCFCIYTEPMRVTVLDGAVIRAVQLSNNATLEPKFVETIPQLFEFVEYSIANHASNFHVSYDAALGYPREIISDGNARVADDEVRYTLSDLTLVALALNRRAYGTAPAAPARRGSAPAVTRPLSIRTAAP
jgi:hypothetical protein